MTLNHDKLGGISSEAVERATGKSWSDWVAILDKEGAKDLPHKEIARLLHDKKYIKSGWWCQMVTVGYEQAHGKRTVGETAATGFEIGARKTISQSAEKTWDLVTSQAGLNIWLGEVASMKLEPGISYKTKNGTKGEIRTLKPGARLRLSWQPKGWTKASTLQVTVEEKGEKSSIGFHQERLADVKTREKMRQRWHNILEQLEAMSQT